MAVFLFSLLIFFLKLWVQFSQLALGAFRSFCEYLSVLDQGCAISAGVRGMFPPLHQHKGGTSKGERVTNEASTFVNVANLGILLTS